MIFGSVALAFRGTTFKVHWLQDPPRIMCSQVFLAPVQSTISPRNSQSTRITGGGIGDQTMEGSSLNSLSLSLCINNDLACSNPLEVPDQENNGGYQHSATDDSGYSGTDPWSPATTSTTSSSRVSNHSSIASVFSDYDHGRKYSIDSYAGEIVSSSNGSIQRRISRHLSTSLENRLTSADLIGHLSEHYVTYGSTYGSELSVPKLRRNSEVVERGIVSDVRKRNAFSGDVLTTGPRKSSARRPRLGIAVCFNINQELEKEMKLFCSEHMVILEGMINKLRMAVESAYISRQKFLQVMLTASHDVSKWLVDLFTAPRIAYPVWLSLSTGYVRNSVQLATGFMKDLNMLMNMLDTKETNFFISRLLTAVLTCHLGWVNTVAPIIEPKQMQKINSVSSIDTLMNDERMKLSEISKLHPYNALWAQLGDLYGSIGSPLRIAKTVLCGSEPHIKIIERILNILTYFIRCGEIKRQRLLNQLRKEDIKKVIENSKSLKSTHEKSHLPIKIPEKLTIPPTKESKPKLMRRSNTQMANLALMAEQMVKDNDNDIPNLSISTAIPCQSSNSSTIVQSIIGDPMISKSQMMHPNNEKDVVFFLGGDNEELVGLKDALTGLTSSGNEDACGRVHKHKRHSGVKFNFEQYPQIAKNYMKNKNLEMNEYEFLDKGIKMELPWKLYSSGSETTSGRTASINLSSAINIAETEEESCDCCKEMGAHYLQTPSNASELEFSNDDLTLQDSSKEHVVQQMTNSNRPTAPLIVISEAISHDQPSLYTGPIRKLPKSFEPLDENRELNTSLDDTSDLKVFNLPMTTQDNGILHLELHNSNLSSNQKLLPGFMPSLFVGISNHYISEMVLQGILLGKNDSGKWENALKQDLMLATRHVSLDQGPTENVAIVANIDKW